ncbi:MAG: triose-phosphate isomerase [Candidatus Nealsonbacteria bacterium CG08_land_8_20_14_0_20_43_11]|uniref:Triosephosphate isomerase n=1 Tax=Candidatus Nealsonbacteria bacterium CG08_land_8_20_14_0_20_43_11 TaxID=1974706 RepID=A0A2M6T0U4_9BACT|nr:MAG: triose-phosphate isomerase [Candidatus Nealsonbacteria bacterium CG08_land_8_20_14_0_20_43_11]
MKPLVAGNWKMNPLTFIEAKEIFSLIEPQAEKAEKTEVVICPPFVFLPLLIKKSVVGFGGQDCFWLDKGAYTGEVSAVMLKNLGCKYVIIGHSERRQYLGETDETVNQKLKAALSAGLNPILCLGETEAERKKGRVESVIKKQIKKAFSEVVLENFVSLNLAYEPVWAIGTGNVCAVKEAMAVKRLIEEEMKKILKPEDLFRLRILYGGSVNAENAAGFIKDGFQGLLVAGASLRTEEFNEIIEKTACF